jgi:hypothetical protein
MRVHEKSPGLAVLFCLTLLSPMRAVTAALSALFLLIAGPLRAQTHCDVHYRWQEKIDATHLARQF